MLIIISPIILFLFKLMQSTLVIIDAVIESSVVYTEGVDLAVSLSQISKENTYRPAPPPPFFPGDFGGDNKNQFSILMQALFNGVYKWTVADYHVADVRTFT